MSKLNDQLPTIRQQRAARKVKEVLESGEELEGKDILTIVGYSDGIARSPKTVFASKGFQRALKNLGFSIEAADLTVAKILRTGKEENQLKASDQIYKRLSAYAPEKHIVGTVSLNKLLEDAQKARR